MPQSLTIWDKFKYYILAPTLFTIDSSLEIFGSRKILREGVLSVLATFMTSLSLGTPSVTFLEEIPALWKVLSVICVAGSPILLAATLPTISPGLTMAASNASLIYLTSSSKL